MTIRSVLTFAARAPTLGLTGPLVIAAVVFAAPTLAHDFPAAPTIVDADRFDEDIASWTSTTAFLDWSDRDAASRADSGSIRVIGAEQGGLRTLIGSAEACSVRVVPGAETQLRAHVFSEADPEVEESGVLSASISMVFFRDASCQEPAEQRWWRDTVHELRSWREARVAATAPADAVAVGVSLTMSGLPGNAAFFDNVVLETSVAQPPSPDEWIEIPSFPAFRFQARIRPASGPARSGTLVQGCIADTACFAGALPHRPEVQVRVLGPRPNGYLWTVMSQLTPSAVEVWIEKVDTGELRYYLLPRAEPGSSVLGAFFDRRAFLPPRE